VSVTQQFNTTSSKGGPYAQSAAVVCVQFEREVTGERIRDKLIGAAHSFGREAPFRTSALYRSADGRDHSRQSVRSHDIGREVPGSPKAVNSRVKPCPLRRSAPKTACTAVVRVPKEHRADTGCRRFGPPENAERSYHDCEDLGKPCLCSRGCRSPGSDRPNLCRAPWGSGRDTGRRNVKADCGTNLKRAPHAPKRCPSRANSKMNRIATPLIWFASSARRPRNVSTGARGSSAARSKARRPERPRRGPPQRALKRTSSIGTERLLSAFGSKAMLIATSARLRPRAISTVRYSGC
jgi:hypothetical protein